MRIHCSLPIVNTMLMFTLLSVYRRPQNSLNSIIIKHVPGGGVVGISEGVSLTGAEGSGGDGVLVGGVLVGGVLAAGASFGGGPFPVRERFTNQRMENYHFPLL